MTDKQVEQLAQLVEDGCVFRVSGPYLDGFSTLTQLDNGNFMIESQVYSQRPAISIGANQVTVFRPVDFPPDTMSPMRKASE